MRSFVILFVALSLSFGLSAQVQIVPDDLPIEVQTVIQQQAYLKARIPDGDDNFGYSVAVSSNMLVVGAPREDGDGSSIYDDSLSEAGAVYVARYSFTFGVRGRPSYIKASNPDAFDRFGTSVALDGDTLVVGAPGRDLGRYDNIRDAGAVYVFVRQNGDWVQQAFLRANNANTEDYFGTSVALDGDTLVVGALEEDGDGSSPDDNSLGRSGAAYVFVRNNGIWAQQAYLKASKLNADDFFGYSVALDGDTLVVGAWGEDGDGSSPDDNSLSNSGAAYVFVRNNGIWTQQAYLKAGNPDEGDVFGVSVAISGDTLVVGARGEDGDGSSPDDNSLEEAGAAYVFVRDGDSWTQQAYLKASNPDEEDVFGISVALDGDTLVVGARGEAGDGSSPDDNSLGAAGAAYIFVRNNGVWTQQAYLKASNPDELDLFGSDVAISGDTLVVGARLEDGDGSSPDDNSLNASGAAYVITIQPEFNPNPAIPGPLAMSGPAGEAATTTFTVDNRTTGSFLLTVGLDSITAGYSITDGLPINGLSGAAAPVEVTVQCDDPATTPNTGELVLQTNENGNPTYTYDLTCELEATPTPTEEPTPTDEPEPTDEPTDEPTPTDDPDPTAEPTVTIEPTDDPNPTAEPTDEPDPCAGVDEAVCRLSPADGAVIATGPEYVSNFQWRDNGAEWYAVYVSEPDFTPFFQFKWYEASEVCDASGVCTATTPIWLVGSGEFAWWMTYWSDGDGSAFLDRWHGSSFSLNFPAPGDLSALTATAETVNGTTTLQWDAEPNTLWYQVWVGPDTYDGNIFFAWQNAAEICMSGTCTIEIPGTPPAGEYQLWLQAWNPVGLQLWSQITSFSVMP